MLLTLCCAIGLSVASCIMMSYISMITPIGPWVELIVVLTASGIIHAIAHRYTASQKATAITNITAASGIAGIIGTACGFVIPTVYFLDAQSYALWFSSPYVAWIAMACLVAAAGGWGIALALYARSWYLGNQRMTFPIGEMVRNVVQMPRQIWSVASLAGGFVVTLMYGVAQHITYAFPRFVYITRRAYTWGYISLPRLALPLDVAPMLIAIGFVAGHVLAVPLLVGIITKIGVLEPLHAIWFPAVEYKNAILAFGSGIIIYSTSTSFIKFPYIIVSGCRWIRGAFDQARNAHQKRAWYMSVIPLFIVFVVGMLVLSLAGFSFVSQLYTMLLTAVCVYQILIIAGKIGLAPFGRFATFLMLPGTLLFAFNATQITAISAFVAIACGVAADTLFGQKAAEGEDVDNTIVMRYQVLGLFVAALIIGPVLWVLFTKLGLGTPELLAQRAQARAVLISMYQFDYSLLACGFVWGAILHLCGVNATLVFSGLLFPVEFSLLLICGGLMTYCCHDTKSWEPLFSGIFAANSLWLVLRAVLKSLA